MGNSDHGTLYTYIESRMIRGVITYPSSDNRGVPLYERSDPVNSATYRGTSLIRNASHTSATIRAWGSY